MRKPFGKTLLEAILRVGHRVGKVEDDLTKAKAHLEEVERRLALLEKNHVKV